MTGNIGNPALPGEQVDSLAPILNAVRSGKALTRPELVRATGLGRNVVSQRVDYLLGSGLLVEGATGPSQGGRAPRQLAFRASAGQVLVAELGASSLGVALTDLDGRVASALEEPCDINAGPELILDRVGQLFGQMLEGGRPAASLWGIGVGLPGPVEFATGKPVVPPIMPGWDGFDVRAFFQDRFSAPVWVDNEVNLMALGEFRDGLARGHSDIVYVKVGTGIGAGLISQGRLHRGALGSAGDIGHIRMGPDTVVCRCGKRGCLEAMAGGAALARQGEDAARSGKSRLLAAVLAERGSVSARDIAEAGRRGDADATDLLLHSAREVGEAVSLLVNVFNPSLVLIGGGVADAGDLYLAEVRRTVLGSSLPLATRNLRILASPTGDQAGLRGAAFMVIDELLSGRLLREWINDGSPAGRAELAGF
nr:ROK family protein [Pseudarthrobacter sp. MDT3-26]